MSTLTPKATTMVQRSRAALMNTAKRFRRDERGNTFVFTALSLPVMLMAIGAGADYAELYRAKVNFQSAVDAGALAAAKNLAATGNIGQSKDIGEEVFRSNLTHLGDKAVREGQINFDMGNGDCGVQGVVTTATLPHDRFFNLKFVDLSQSKGKGANEIKKDGPNEFMLEASTTVECGNDTIEVALVLDNSGSMGWNGKLNTLKQASTSLVETLHTTMGSNNKQIQFSVVPFSAMVNVGTDKRNAPWMDSQGRSPLHWDLIDPSTSTTNHFQQTGNRWLYKGRPFSRFTLYDNLPSTNWSGCVEQRKHPYHTQDVLPTNADPDSLFVPAFAADTPDDWSGDKDQVRAVAPGNPYCTRFQSEWRGRKRRAIRYCERWSDGRRGRKHYTNPRYRPHWDDRIEYKRGKLIRQNPTQTTWQDDRTINEERYHNNYLSDSHGFNVTDTEHYLSKENTGEDNDDQLKRMTWIDKYLRDSSNSSPSRPSGGSPNDACTAIAISDLTDNKRTTQNKLSAMQATGTTNIQMGLAWGWRTLSPSEPFTKGRPYDAEDNKKILIVMTDGNHYYPAQTSNSYSRRIKSRYGAHGNQMTQGTKTNERIFDGYDGAANPNHDNRTYTRAMDEHLTETCTNAKNAGITIYSIAFDVPNGSSVKATMEDCASADIGGGKLYFDARNNAALIDTFEKIAERLADLRISK
ncbi:MAG: pilus assembly protein [Pseudomonadota bacterium]